VRSRDLLWSLLVGLLLREGTHHAVEALVGSPARRALGVRRRFGDDTLGYFTERLDPDVTRTALARTVCRARRNKAFAHCPRIGLALDGTGSGRSRKARCGLCHPVRDDGGTPRVHLHHFCMVSVAGTGLSLPLDVEPYGPGDSEYAAGQRLLRRVVGRLGPRFADHVVVDGGFATAPFLHAAGDLGLAVVARLKDNLPELFRAAQQRFAQQPPLLTLHPAGERVDLWDAEDFDPWETLRWPTVRVLRYRQFRRDGTVLEAYWLTDYPRHQVGPQALYHIAKSRWEIENQGFNDGKNRYGLEHIAHHHPNSLLMGWLLTVLALTIERLFRLRYLHRGSHKPHSAMTLVRLLRLSLIPSHPTDTS
jgi:hypothetical protein